MNVRAFISEILLIGTVSAYIPTAAAQATAGNDLAEAYAALHDFTLDGGEARVENLTLKRDRGG
jgi:hypothetical protein